MSHFSYYEFIRTKRHMNQESKVMYAYITWLKREYTLAQGFKFKP